MKKWPLAIGDEIPNTVAWRNDPHRLAAAHRTSDVRLRDARRRWPYVPLNLGLLVGYKGKRIGYRPLPSVRLLIRVPEPMDAWDLWADIRRFVTGWRPARLRSEAGQKAATDLLTQWERLGGDLRR